MLSKWSESRQSICVRLCAYMYGCCIYIFINILSSNDKIKTEHSSEHVILTENIQKSCTDEAHETTTDNK